jgi:hypothetical protein
MSFHEVELSDPPFSPYVFIDTSEKWPSSLSAAGWSANGMKYIKLDASSTAESLPDVQQISRNHFSRDQGKVILYGDIVGFRFVFSPTDSFLLDTDGNVVARQTGKFWPRSITMKVDGRD